MHHFSLQAWLEFAVVFGPLFFFVYRKKSPRWNFTKPIRIFTSILIAALITIAFFSIGGILLIVFFPGYCYGL